MKTSVMWIIDRYLLDHPNLTQFVDILNKKQINHHVTRYVPMSKKNAPLPEGYNNFIFYGTLGYLNNAKKSGYSKGVFDLKDYTLLDIFENCKELPFINADAEIYTIAELVNNKENILDNFKSSNVFIRPVKDNKAFPGGIANIDRLNYLSDYILNYSSYFTEPTDLIMIKKPNTINKEWRFIVCDGEVITGSLYKFYTNLYLSEIEDNLSKEWLLAKKMAEHHWQPSPCYTCDIAELEDGSLHIIELNSFSGAGWYLCNKEKIIERVTEFAEKLYFNHWGYHYV